MSLSFTALLLIAHGIVSDTSCRPVECLKHATMFVPSFALRPLDSIHCRSLVHAFTTSGGHILDYLCH